MGAAVPTRSAVALRLLALLVGLSGAPPLRADPPSPPRRPPLEPAERPPRRAGARPTGMSPWGMIAWFDALRARLPKSAADPSAPALPAAPRLLVLGARGERVLDFRAVVHHGAHQREARGTTGDLRLDPRRDFDWSEGGSPAATYVDLAEARDVEGALLPLAPVRVGPIDPDDEPVVRVTLARRPWLVGRVTDAQGAPVKGVTVWVLPADGPEPGRACGAGPAALPPALPPFLLSLEVETGEDGTYRYLPLPGPGVSLRLRTGAGWLEPSDEVVPPEGPAPAFVLRRAAEVRVRVLAPDGTPLPGVNLWAKRDGGARTAGALSDQDGWALFDDVERGERFVELALCPPVDRMDLRPSSIAGWRALEGDILVERGHVLSGTVRDDAGRALKGVIVEALSDQGFDVSDRTDAEGRYAIGRLRAGAFVLRATYLRKAATVRADLEVRGEQGAADLVMPPSRSVRVRLLGSQGSGSGSGGRPMPRLLVEGPAGWQDEGYVAGASTFDDALLVRGLPLGRRAALLWPGIGGRMAYGLLPAEAEQVEVRWWPTVSVAGRVLDAPEGATVEVTLSDGAALHEVVRPAPDGAFRFHRVPRVGLAVAATATTPDGRRLTARADVPPGAPDGSDDPPAPFNLRLRR